MEAEAWRDTRLGRWRCEELETDDTWPWKDRIPSGALEQPLALVLPLARAIVDCRALDLTHRLERACVAIVDVNVQAWTPRDERCNRVHVVVGMGARSRGGGDHVALGERALEEGWTGWWCGRRGWCRRWGW